MTITPETIAELRADIANARPFVGHGFVRPPCVGVWADTMTALLDAAVEVEPLCEWVEELKGERDSVYAAMTRAHVENAALRADLAEVTAERDALAASVARVRAQVEEWEARASFNEASLVHHPDDFWHGMATKGRECADEARRALDGTDA